MSSRQRQRASSRAPRTNAPPRSPAPTGLAAPPNPGASPRTSASPCWEPPSRSRARWSKTPCSRAGCCSRSPRRAGCSSGPAAHRDPARRAGTGGGLVHRRHRPAERAARGRLRLRRRDRADPLHARRDGRRCDVCHHVAAVQFGHRHRSTWRVMCYVPSRIARRGRGGCILVLRGCAESRGCGQYGGARAEPSPGLRHGGSTGGGANRENLL